MKEKIDLRKSLKIVLLLICIFTVSSSLSTSISIGASSNSVGPQETIIILVEFSDLKHSLDSKDIAKTIFTDMNAYFKEQSYNQTWLVGSTTNTWYQLSGPINTYAPWPRRQGEIHWERVTPFIVESLRLANPDVDLGMYQRIVIVHSGSGGSQSMAFGLSFYYWPISFMTRNGKTIRDVIVIGEYEDFSVICHEFTHYLGGYAEGQSIVPDLYDFALLSKNEYSTIYMGLWDLMSGQTGSPGPKGVQGLSSWTKMKLGWMKEKQIAQSSTGEAATFALNPLELASDGIQVIRIPIFGNRYYLVENRQRTGSDEALPDSGILIMLADDYLYNSGQSGPVRVIDSTPSAPRLTKATFDIRADKPASFFDRDNDIAIVIMYKSGLAYKIFVGSVSQGEAVLKDSEKAQAVVKAIDEASASIQKAQAEGRTSDLEKAKLLLVNATMALEKQEFDNAVMLARQVKSMADASTKPLTVTATRPVTQAITTPSAEVSYSQYAAVGIVAAVLVIFGLLVSSRKRKKQTDARH